MSRFMIPAILGFLAVNQICAVETAVHRLDVTVVGIDKGGRIHVALHNAAQEPLRLWRDSNSWGAARWRVLHISQGKLNTYFESPDQVFTRNFPEYDELRVAGDVRVELDLTGAEWRSSTGETPSFRDGDTIVIVYDVPSSEEARTLGVWYGVAGSVVPFRSSIRE